MWDSSCFHNYLPKELLREVLARLPVKSLLKLRCVSKLWRDLIDDPDFISMRDHYNSNKKYLATWEISCEDPEGCRMNPEDCIFSARRFDTGSRFGHPLKKMFYSEALASSNGLFLIRHYYDVKGTSIRKGSYMLWNPCVRKSLLIPPCPFAGIGVIGYAPSSNEYKVCVLRCYDIEPSFAIYGLNNGDWRCVRSKCTRFRFNDWRSSSEFVYSKGCAYRSMFRYVWHDPECREYCLVSFSFDDEELTCVDLPDNINSLVRKTRNYMFAFLLEESLSVSVISPSGSFNVWVMDKEMGAKEYSWTHWYSKNINPTVYACLQSSIRLQFLYFDKTCLYFKNNTHGKLIRYNIESQEIKEHDDGIKFLYISIHVERLWLSNSKGLMEGQTLGPIEEASVHTVPASKSSDYMQNISQRQEGASMGMLADIITLKRRLRRKFWSLIFWVYQYVRWQKSAPSTCAMVLVAMALIVGSIILILQ